MIVLELILSDQWSLCFDFLSLTSKWGLVVELDRGGTGREEIMGVTAELMVTRALDTWILVNRSREWSHDKPFCDLHFPRPSVDFMEQAEWQSR